MCFIPNDKMALTHSITQKLQSLVQRQQCFSNQQNLKDLSKDDYAQYMNIRTACFHLIRIPHKHFHTGPDTFAAAINILDVFLWKVKVTVRHISIVSVACYYIALKILENGENHPSAKELSSRYEWTANDLCRMELNILQKLGWYAPTVSYGDFLSIFAEVYGININHLHCDEVTVLAQKCLSLQPTVLMQPAVLALSLLHHIKSEMRTSPLRPQVVVHCNIQETQLRFCQENVVSVAALSQISATRFQLKMHKRKYDKPSEIGTTCLSTIIEEPSA
ncbi:unnamed protein product [Lymnaea stagnalis]|uniref:Cyclin-like domain-containing protein n=1 Tax=Lymnaea stagnalis TaxID=6523 RepID=A0AAV2HXR2_LYMST